MCSSASSLRCPCRTLSLQTHAPGRPPRLRLRSHPFRLGRQGCSVVGAVCLLQGPSPAALLSKQGSATVWSPRQVSKIVAVCCMHTLLRCRFDPLSPAFAYAPTACYPQVGCACHDASADRVPLKVSPCSGATAAAPPYWAGNAKMTPSTSLSDCIRGQERQLIWQHQGPLMLALTLVPATACNGLEAALPA